MARRAQDVTDAELAILQVLWEQQGATVRELAERLYPSGTPSDLATVQKLLKRLEDKHCVLKKTTTRPQVYVALLERDDLIGQRLQSTADDLCSGSLMPLLSRLVRARPLTQEDRNALRELLDTTEKPPRSE
jgi:BlaI family transcriptional regulator, penicillinase repressor